VILRVKKRGDGGSASPTLRLKGEKALGERGPWELLGGVPRRCGSASVVQRPRGSQQEKMRRNSSARARDGRGGWFAGRGGGARMVFAGDGFLRWMVCEGGGW
jgi:hypothetical protein